MASLLRSSMPPQIHRLALSNITFAPSLITTTRASTYSHARNSFPAAFLAFKSFRPRKLAILSQKAAFHNSAARPILPPLPQRIDGTANDPAPVPEPSPTHGSYHWTFERLLAAGLIPLTIAPFAVGSLNPMMDAFLCGSIIIHSHIGFQACIIDYFPTKRVPKTRAALWWVLRGATVLVGVGLYEFETNDIGVTEAIKKIWAS